MQPVDRRNRTVIVLGSLAASVFVAVVTLLERMHVTGPPPSSGYHLSLGWPFDWVEQESTLTPPVPWDITIGNPMENATRFDLWALGADVFVLWLAFLAVAVLARTVSRRESPTATRRALV